jgi:hypothetical protein
VAGRTASVCAERRHCHFLGLLRISLCALSVTALAATAAALVTGTTVASAQNASTTTTAPGSGTAILPNRQSPPAPAAENSAATTLVLRAIAAEKLMGSVHLDGTIKQGKSLVSLHLVLNGDGDGAGQFTQAGYPIKLSRTGQLLYFNASEKFWASHASKALAARYGGKWLEFSALDSSLASFDRFLNASDLVAATFTGHQTPLTLSQPTTFDHHKVVVVKDVSTTGGHTVTSTMDIASTGQPYVYRIADRSPTEVSTLVLSKYGKAVKVSAPAHALNLTSSATTTTASP